MTDKYSPELRERAVRMVSDHAGEHRRTLKFPPTSIGERLKNESILRD